MRIKWVNIYKVLRTVFDTHSTLYMNIHVYIIEYYIIIMCPEGS